PTTKLFPYTTLFRSLRFANYPEAYNYAALNFGQMLGNSFIITITSVIGAVVSSTIVAFGFSRLRWRGRDQIFVLVILTMIIPGEDRKSTRLNSSHVS